MAVGGGSVWIADDERDVIVRLNEEDGSVQGEPLAVGRDPVALAHDGTRLFVAHAGGFVTAVGPGGIEGATIQTGGTLVDVVAGASSVWVADIARSVVQRIDPVTRRPDPPIPIPDGAVRLALTPTRLWVSNLVRTVTAIDLTTGAVGPPVPVGNVPIGLTAVGGVLWVTNSDDDTVSRLDPETGAAVGPPRGVGNAPIEVVADDGQLWIANQDGQSVSRLRVPGGVSLGDAVDVGFRPRGIALSERGLWAVGVDPGGAVLIRRTAS